MRSSRLSPSAIPLFLLAALPVGVLGNDILSSNGYTTCFNNPDVKVNALNISFDRSAKKVTFDVSGTSTVTAQNITAEIQAFAYGRQVYNNTFNPCSDDTFVQQLCPVPNGTFSAQGTQDIPDKYISMIPSIAFSVPDLDGQAQLTIKDSDGKELACIQSAVGNGRTMNTPAVSYIAGGIAASALAFSALGAMAGGSAPGSPAPSPNFGEVIGWFQTLATSGMLSVKYPAVYQNFAKNFAFSTGLIPWGSMQVAIDNFRQSTGGNLTQDNYQYLQNVTTVATANGNSTSTLFKRAVLSAAVFARDITTDINGDSTTTGNGTSSNSTSESKEMHYVHGIQAYVEQLMVPQANTFMTVLLIFAIVVAAITVLILLGKVILEGIAMTSKLPHSLESWRKRYWWRLAKAVTNLIFILYGIWTLYCVYQFTNGDSWAAKTLAGVTWGLFTALLAFFTWRIVSKARKFKKMDGDTSALYENKETWVKYSLFYDSFKKGYWWIFIPAIIYMFARNTVIAAANGHGMAQAIGQGIVEALMLLLLIWNRPYQLKSGNIVNIVIQTVRVLSVVCILVFVEELGISQTTQTVTGLVLIVVQSVLTGVLGILLAVNAIMMCVKENPHRRRRKEQEKKQRDLDNLTPLDARNSLLMDSSQLTEYKGAHPNVAMTKAPLVSPSLPAVTSHGRYDPVPRRDTSPTYTSPGRSRTFGSHPNESSDNLVHGAAAFGRDRSQSPQPRLPNVNFGRAY